MNNKKLKKSSVDLMVDQLNKDDKDFREGMGKLLNLKNKVKFVKGGNKK